MELLNQIKKLGQIIPGVFIIPPILSTNDIERILAVNNIKSSHHQDEGGHGHRTPIKPHNISWLSDLIWDNIPRDKINGFYPISVDSNMKLYRLMEGSGKVDPHQDIDYNGSDGSIAKFSILMYLNDDFSGGETVFNGNVYAPHLPSGGGLLFRHDILHEGLIVKNGEKMVIKTDLFVNE